MDTTPAVPVDEAAAGGIAARADARFARLRAEARAAVVDGTTARRLAS